MTALAVDERLYGSQTARVHSVPPYASSTGVEAIELCRMAGLDLLPWQQTVLKDALGENPDGSWAAPEVALIVGRQNGKSALFEARILTGLFLLDEQLIVYSAHQWDTSMEEFLRVKYLIENTPDLSRRVKRFNQTHGQEGIELTNGQRARFRTRTKGGGRGFSGQCVLFDEAMMFPESAHAAILPVISAQANPQAWYAGSAVDQLENENGYVLARLRARGVKGGDPRLAYFEWSADRATPSDVEPETALDPGSWQVSNPSLGYLISPDYVAGEYESLGPRAFAVERLGVGDWPDLTGESSAVISPTAWLALADPDAVLQDPVCIAFDVTPDRSSSSVSAAGLSTVGRPMVEVVRQDRGVGWVIPYLLELQGKHKPLTVACDGTGAAGSLLVELGAQGLEVEPLTTAEHTKGCGVLYDAVTEGRLTHLGQRMLDVAVRGATKRPIGGAWLWNRKTSAVDISPLVACTLALAAFTVRTNTAPRPVPRVINLNDLPDD